MKCPYIFLIFVLFTMCCFASEGYNVLVNPQNPNIKTSANSQTLFILDYSNSMNEFLCDRTKFSLLLESMKIILKQISSDEKIGVRVYGHKLGFTPYDACRASSLLVPIASNNVIPIASSLSKLKPRGMTPITYSLKQAVKNDFKNANGEKHIVLITDGGENCDESPCTYAMELIKHRKDIKIDVIALNMHNEDDLDQLLCTATVTSGKLYKADTKAELLNSLEKTFKSKKQVDAIIVPNY